MRKLLFTLLASGMMLSANAQTGYTITGQSEGTVDGDTIYLCDMQGFFEMIPEDSAYVKEGKYTFKGSCDGAKMRYILPIHNGKPVGTADVIIENAPISVQTFLQEKKETIIVGGPTTQLYKEYQGKNPYTNEINTIWAVAMDSTKTDAVRAAAKEKTDSLNKLEQTWQKQFIASHIPTPFSDMMLKSFKWTDDELNTMLNEWAKAPVQYANYKLLVKERAATAATAIGKKYTDIELKDPSGKNIKVSDYVKKNKYTLIDFWASWCGPCRAEMPNVVKAYTLYHNKGLEVVGISLDNNKAAWVKALSQLHMPWPQMSDLKGWQSAGAAAYNIKAIPSNALVDQKGNIIAKDLREKDLQDKLAELFK